MSSYNLFNNMSYLSSNQLKQYKDEGFVSPIDIFSKEKAKDICIELCEKLLSNPVIENYEIEIN